MLFFMQLYFAMSVTKEATLVSLLCNSHNPGLVFYNLVLKGEFLHEEKVASFHVSSSVRHVQITHDISLHPLDKCTALSSAVLFKL